MTVHLAAVVLVHDVTAVEFLIRTQDSHPWPAIPRDRISQVLTPRDWDCAQVVGWGEHRLRCGETEISLSGEDVGWHVAFDGPIALDAAERFVAAVTAQVQQEVRETVEWIQIS